ncbi:hypothetical protein [Rubripirellula reticaptiva]|nr:hypothetical protein [Rubripirellula reticaptiva]
MKRFSITMHLSAKLGLPVLIASVTVGCGSDPDTLGTLREIVSQTSHSTKSGNFGSDRDTVASGADVRKFTAPYPDRQDAFAYPGQSPEANVAVVSATSVAEFKVLGFANVGEPRVFLKSKSATKSVAVGEKFDGVHVLEINPPRVELQMGTLVWTATMFDNSR